MDGKNCGVYLLNQAQRTIDKSFCLPQDPAVLRLHFARLLLAPTLRRLEMHPRKHIRDAQEQLPSLTKRPRLYFDVLDGSKVKPDIADMVNAVGNPAVFADLAVLLQSTAVESYSGMGIVEMAMQSYTSSGAGMVANKITRIHACMIVQERFTELVIQYRYQLQTHKKLRKSVRRKGTEVPSENTHGKDARHHALIDLVSEWQGIPSTEVPGQHDYKNQRRAVEEAKKIGQHCLELQKHWEDQPLWPLIPHKPILTCKGLSTIDAER
jgi:hypothetical protein